MIWSFRFSGLRMRKVGVKCSLRSLHTFGQLCCHTRIELDSNHFLALFKKFHGQISSTGPDLQNGIAGFDVGLNETHEKCALSMDNSLTFSIIPFTTNGFFSMCCPSCLLSSGPWYRAVDNSFTIFGIVKCGQSHTATHPFSSRLESFALRLRQPLHFSIIHSLLVFLKPTVLAKAIRWCNRKLSL